MSKKIKITNGLPRGRAYLGHIQIGFLENNFGYVEVVFELKNLPPGSTCYLWRQGQLPSLVGQESQGKINFSHSGEPGDEFFLKIFGKNGEEAVFFFEI